MGLVRALSAVTILAGCHHSDPVTVVSLAPLPSIDAGISRPPTPGKCEASASGPGLDKRALLIALVPSFDKATGTIAVEPATDDAGDAYHFARDCFGVERSAGEEPSATETARSKPEVLGSTLIDEGAHTYAAWVKLGTALSYCGGPFGVLVLASVGDGRIEVLAVGADNLECAYGTTIRRVSLGGREVLITTAQTGSEHGGRELERVWRLDGSALRNLGEYVTSGSEGRPDEGAVTDYDAVVSYEADRIVVRETAREKKCDTSLPSLPCKTIHQKLTTRRYAISDAALTAE